MCLGQIVPDQIFSRTKCGLGRSHLGWIKSDQRILGCGFSMSGTILARLKSVLDMHKLGSKYNGFVRIKLADSYGLGSAQVVFERTSANSSRIWVELEWSGHYMSKSVRF